MLEQYHKEFTRTRFGKNRYTVYRHNGTSSSVESATVASFLNSLDGEKNPKWRDQVARGQQAGTTLNAYESLASKLPWFTAAEDYITKPPYTPAPTWTSGKDQIFFHYDTWLDSVDASSLDVTQADNEALTNYVNGIRDVQTSFQGSVFIGELPEALSLITNPARAIRSGFKGFIDGATSLRRSLRNLSSQRKREILADTWLEYSFGWKPFANDLAEGLETFAKSTVNGFRGPWKAVRGVGTHEIVLSDDSIALGPTTPRFSGRRRRKSVAQVRYIGQVDQSLNAVYDMQNMGLDPHSAPLAAWEIVPWSFMIDYFTNIGDVISAASLARSDLRWTIRTIRKKYVSELYDMYPEHANINSKFKYSQLAGSYFSNRPLVKKHVYRSPYNGSLVPSLEFSIPGSSTKWLNIAALWTGRKNLRSIYLT